MGRDRDETKNLNPGYHKGTNRAGGGGGNGGGGKNRRPAEGFEKGDLRRSDLDVRRSDPMPKKRPHSE